MNDQLEKVYFELAFTELAMDYYCLNERDRELEGGAESGPRFGEIRKRLEELIKSCFSDFENLSETGKKAEDLRNELKAKVEALVKKIDRLELEKYVSIRSETEDEKFDYPDDDEAAKVILRSIFSTDDNTVINERIKMAVYELPVRMTKIRFFDILKNALKLYIGSGLDVLKRAEYMLESTSGISGDREFAELDLTKADIDELTEEYDYLNDLAGICNYICVIGRCSEEIRTSEREKIEKLLKLLEASSALDEESNISDAERILTELEGKLEELSQRKVVLEAKLEGYMESEAKANEQILKLDGMRRLMSTSIYADLDIEESGEADEKNVEETFSRLSDALSEAFKKGDKALNRARQAAVLSALPVFFNNRTEVMNYVRDSLASCGNIHEKNVAVSKIISSDF